MIDMRVKYMQPITPSILKKLTKPKAESHKGQNGRILIIAGSKKYHGSLLLAIEAASRIVDIVYVHTNKENFDLVKKLREQTAVFIYTSTKELTETIQVCDSVLIGPGLAESKSNIRLIHNLLKKFPEKKFIIDATAMWHLNPESLNSNCILTPHHREFTNVFGLEPTADNTMQMAKKYHCLIVLKGRIDYVSDGESLWENHTGNQGMTKGGTGDVLAGLITAFSAKNDSITASLAGIYLNGYLGDRMHKKQGTFYNAEDLVGELGRVWKRW